MHKTRVIIPLLFVSEVQHAYRYEGMLVIVTGDYYATILFSQLRSIWFVSYLELYKRGPHAF